MDEEEKKDLENLEENKAHKDTGGMLKAYTIFSQGLFTIIILGGLGFFIGWKIDKKSALPGVLAVVGGLIGLINFIFVVYKNHYFDDLPKTKNSDGDKNEEGK